MYHLIKWIKVCLLVADGRLWVGNLILLDPLSRVVVLLACWKELFGSLRYAPFWRMTQSHYSGVIGGKEMIIVLKIA